MFAVFPFNYCFWPACSVQEMFCKQKGYLEEELDYRKQALDQAYMVSVHVCVFLCHAYYCITLWGQNLFTVTQLGKQYFVPFKDQYSVHMLIIYCIYGLWLELWQVKSLFLLSTANPGIGGNVIQRPAAGQGLFYFTTYYSLSKQNFTKDSFLFCLNASTSCKKNSNYIYVIWNTRPVRFVFLSVFVCFAFDDHANPTNLHYPHGVYMSNIHVLF